MFVPCMLRDSLERGREGEKSQEDRERKQPGFPPEGEGRRREQPGLDGNGGLVVMEKEAGSSGSTLSVRGEGGLRELGVSMHTTGFEITLNSAQSRGWRRRGRKQLVEFFPKQ